MRGPEQPPIRARVKISPRTLHVKVPCKNKTNATNVCDSIQDLSGKFLSRHPVHEWPCRWLCCSYILMAVDNSFVGKIASASGMSMSCFHRKESWRINSWQWDGTAWKQMPMLLAILIRLLIQKHHKNNVKMSAFIFSVAHLLSPYLSFTAVSPC